MARVIPLGSDEHHAVQSLLPWYVTGTLEHDEAQRVRDHLAQCERCQADVQWQQRLRASVPGPQATSDASVDRDWAALRRRLDQEQATAPPRQRPRAFAQWIGARWMQVTIGLQGAMVLVLAIALVWAVTPNRDDAYRALGAAPAAVTANALIVFRPTATESEIRRTLRSNHALLVGGPTVTDAYLVRLATISPEALSRLRAEGTVLRVESLEGEQR